MIMLRNENKTGDVKKKKHLNNPFMEKWKLIPAEYLNLTRKQNIQYK